MKLKVITLDKTQTIEMKSSSTVADLFKKLNMNPETYIVKRGKKIIIETEKLKDKDVIEFIKIVSGG